jgi:hypothetical protein
MCELGWINYFQYFIRVLHFWIKWGEIYYHGHESIAQSNAFALPWWNKIVITKPKGIAKQ